MLVCLSVCMLVIFLRSELCRRAHVQNERTRCERHFMVEWTPARSLTVTNSVTCSHTDDRYRQTQWRPESQTEKERWYDRRPKAGLQLMHIWNRLPFEKLSPIFYAFKISSFIYLCYFHLPIGCISDSAVAGDNMRLINVFVSFIGLNSPLYQLDTVFSHNVSKSCWYRNKN